MLQSFLRKDGTPVASAVVGLVAAAVAVTIYCISSTDRTDDAKAPSNGTPPYLPSRLPFLGNTLEIMRNAPRLHDWLAEKLLPRDGQPFLVRLPGKPTMMMTARPEHFEEILKTQIDNFARSEAEHDEYFEVLGDSIVTTNGATWKRQRQVFVRLFSARALRENMTPLSQKYVVQLGNVLAEAAAACKTVDLCNLVHRYTLDVFAEIGFGTEMELLRSGASDPQPFEEALEVAQYWSSRRMKQPTFMWKLKRWLNVGSERELLEAVRVIDDHVMSIVAEAFERKRLAGERAEPSPTETRPKRDIISIILDHMQSDEAPMEQAMVRDIAVAAVIAGRDTTASSLAWLFHVLAHNPRVENKLRAELLAKIPKLATDENYMPSVEEINAVTYVEATIRELLRLYPAGPVIAAHCVRDTVFPDGTFVPKDTFVTLSFYTTGRLTSVWGPNADVFMPERFLDAESGKLLAVASTKLCAFSSGPRNCVGQNLAMLEMKIVIASVVGRFHFVPDPQQKDVVGTEGITLGMKHPLLMRVERVAATSTRAVE